MPYNRISAWMRGIPAVKAQLRTIDRYVKREGRDEMVRGGYNAAGVMFEKNFASEGKLVGGWAQLRERTQREREALGFDAQHPILYRYGDLKYVTATSLTNATGSATFTATDAQGKSISVSLNISRGSGEARADGIKSINQGTRQYWFTTGPVNRAVRAEAAEVLDHGIVGLF